MTLDLSEETLASIDPSTRLHLSLYEPFLFFLPFPLNCFVKIVPSNSGHLLPLVVFADGFRGCAGPSQLLNLTIFMWQLYPEPVFFQTCVCILILRPVQGCAEESVCVCGGGEGIVENCYFVS